MLTRSTTLEQHYQIGVVPVSLRTCVPTIHNDFLALYDNWRREAPAADAITVEVLPRRATWISRHRFDVRVNGRTIFQPSLAAEVLPYVEWGVTWELPTALPQYLQLHAAALQISGRGVILPGDSGSGKSTLAAALVARGARYYCDEFALIHAESLDLHPYPRAICLKASAYPVVESAGISLTGLHEYLKGSKGSVTLLPPARLRRDALASPAPPSCVVFPRYVAGAATNLSQISRPDALARLHGVCFNLLKCRSLGLDVLMRTVQAANTYELVSGDLQRACELVEQAAGGFAQPRLKTA